MITIIWDCPNVEPLVTGCHWSEMDYYWGHEAPNYPVPAKLTMNDEQGRRYSAYRWLDNFDGFWSGSGPRARSFSW